MKWYGQKGEEQSKLKHKKSTKFVTDVLYILKLSLNLLSVAQMIKKGYYVSFEKKKLCIIKDTDGSELSKIRMVGNNFFVKLDNLKECSFSVA